MKYLTNDAYCMNFTPGVNTAALFAKEMRVVLQLMGSRKSNLVLLQNLKTATDKLHFPFRQHDSHEFLLLMLNWLHEDFNKEVTSLHLTDVTNSQPSIIHSLFQSKNQHTI